MVIEVINRSAHPLPSYKTSGAAGMDLRACLPAPIQLQPMERALVGTGLLVAFPSGYEGQVRPRSGLAIKHGITVLNSPGTINADFREEIRVLLVNFSKEPFTIADGYRIAQLVITRTEQRAWEEVNTLTPTARGTGGFGSTGLA